MVQFSELAIPFVIFLIAINTIFAATSNMPDGQLDNSGSLFSDTIIDINNSMYTFVDTIDSDVNQMSSTDDLNNQTDLSVTSTDLGSIIFNIGNSVTGGGLTYVVKFLGFITQMAFGYNTWLNYFFKPAWGPVVSTMGLIFKGFFFIIQLYAVVSLFTALVGRKI